jgi:serine/threonine protein kinase
LPEIDELQEVCFDFIQVDEDQTREPLKVAQLQEPSTTPHKRNSMGLSSLLLLTKGNSGSKLLERRGRALSDLVAPTPTKIKNSLTSPGQSFYEKYKVNKNDRKGRGSFASVYAVEPLSTTSTHGDTHKVVKICNVEEPPLLNACTNEVDILKKLPHHPNVMQLCDYFLMENPAQYFIVLEEAGDESLESYVKREKPLSYEKLRSFSKQLLSAVAHFHQNKVCHRDLKPDNLLIKSDELRVIDFNVAWDFSENPVIHGTTGVEEWSAPETRKLSGYDEKCDLWSVGCLILYMLNGKFTPTPADAVSWRISEHISEPDFDKLEDLLSKLLVIDPVARINSEEALCHPWLL